MEAIILQVVNLIIGLADKHQWIAIVCLIIGGLYLALSALRGILTIVVKLTKTETDDKIIGAIFAFLDKYAYGFGPFAEYFEKKKEDKKK